MIVSEKRRLRYWLCFVVDRREMNISGFAAMTGVNHDWFGGWDENGECGEAASLNFPRFLRKVGFCV